MSSWADRQQAWSSSPHPETQPLGIQFTQPVGNSLLHGRLHHRHQGSSFLEAQAKAETLNHNTRERRGKEQWEDLQLSVHADSFDVLWLCARMPVVGARGDRSSPERRCGLQFLFFLSHMLILRNTDLEHGTRQNSRMYKCQPSTTNTTHAKEPRSIDFGWDLNMAPDEAENTR